MWFTFVDEKEMRGMGCMTLFAYGEFLLRVNYEV